MKKAFAKIKIGEIIRLSGLIIIVGLLLLIQFSYGKPQNEQIPGRAPSWLLGEQYEISQGKCKLMFFPLVNNLAETSIIHGKWSGELDYLIIGLSEIVPIEESIINYEHQENIVLSEADFSFVDKDGTALVEPGEYEIYCVGEQGRFHSKGFFVTFE